MKKTYMYVISGCKPPTPVPIITYGTMSFDLILILNFNQGHACKTSKALIKYILNSLNQPILTLTSKTIISCHLKALLNLHHTVNKY